MGRPYVIVVLFFECIVAPSVCGQPDPCPADDPATYELQPHESLRQPRSHPGNATSTIPLFSTSLLTAPAESWNELANTRFQQWVTALIWWNLGAPLDTAVPVHEPAHLPDTSIHYWRNTRGGTDRYERFSTTTLLCSCVPQPDVPPPANPRLPKPTTPTTKRWHANYHLPRADAKLPAAYSERDRKSVLRDATATASTDAADRVHVATTTTTTTTGVWRVTNQSIQPDDAAWHSLHHISDARLAERRVSRPTTAVGLTSIWHEFLFFRSSISLVLGPDFGHVFIIIHRFHHCYPFIGATGFLSAGMILCHVLHYGTLFPC